MPGITSVTAFGLRITVTGSDIAAARIRKVHDGVKRARTVGVDRVGKYLYDKKRSDCKAGLYGGRAVGPNTYRFGWEYLGGPAITKFTGATLNAHRLGKRVNTSSGDRIEVVLDTTLAPHAALIHGNIEGNEEYFLNPMLRMLVKTRPWMKITKEERGEAIRIIKFTYQKRY